MAIDKSDLMEKFLDTNKLWATEGSKGVANLKKIIEVVGYDSIEEFLTDNSGAVCDIIEFVAKMIETNLFWEQAFRDEVEEQKPRNEVLDALVQSVDQLDEAEMLEAARQHWREKYSKMSDKDLEIEYSVIFDEDVTISKA